MLKVLIANVHEEASGGGGYWSWQIIQAISKNCEVYLIKKPNLKRLKNNPELEFKYKMYDLDKDYDYFVDIGHFSSFKCTRAKKNIKVVYFPNIRHASDPYDHIVTLSDYSKKFVKLYWGKDSLICKPYSKDLKPSTKEKNTITCIGNMFFEADGHSKNQHLLIDAFKKLGHDWRLYLIGNAINKSFINELESRSKGFNIEILVSPPDSVKEEILCKSEFFWSANGLGRSKPEQTEHFGLAAEEALKAGCLTYVHNSGGASDFCASWNNLNELLKMTSEREPNKSEVSFSTPEETELFWKELLV